MRTMDDLERYLGLSGQPFDKVGEGTYLMQLQPWGVQLVVRWEPPIVLFRMKVMDMPRERREEFLATLLRLNAGGLAHGAYGLENDHVILTDALEAENLDPNEFMATLESFELALSQHRDALARFQH